MFPGLGTQKFPCTPDKIKQLIMEKAVHGHYLMVGFAGLPRSGKSTVLNGIISRKLEGVKRLKHQCSLRETRIFEVAYMKHPLNHKSKWYAMAQSDCSSITITVGLAQLCAQMKAMPLFPEGSSTVSFGMDILDQTFACILDEVKRTTSIPCFREEIGSILGTSLAFLNVWDCGVNRALYEIMPFIAKGCDRLIIASFLDLFRDATKLYAHPDLSNYAKGNESGSLLRMRSRLHYLLRIAGVIKSSNSDVNDATRVVHIGTYANQTSTKEGQSKWKELAKNAKKAIEIRAIEAGVSDLLYPELLSVNIHSEEDAKVVKSVLETMIKASKGCECDMPLKWIFLQSAMSKCARVNGRFYVYWEEFLNIAQKCCVNEKKEIDKFLATFKGGCSILYCPQLPALASKIITDPITFLQSLEQLYYPDELFPSNPEVKSHAQSCLPKGIICQELAREMWGKDASFFLELLEDVGLATALSKNYDEICPGCTSTKCYFMPSLRETRYDMKPSPHTKSLFVTFNTDYVPAYIQAHFVRHIGFHFSDIQLRNNEYYNATFLTLSQANDQISIGIIVHGDVVEIQVNPTVHLPEEMISDIYSRLKTLAVEIFGRVSTTVLGMKFELALVCPASNKVSCRREIHYRPFHICSTSATDLFCSSCNISTELDEDKKLWISATYIVS